MQQVAKCRVTSECYPVTSSCTHNHAYISISTFAALSGAQEAACSFCSLAISSGKTHCDFFVIVLKK